MWSTSWGVSNSLHGFGCYLARLLLFGMYSTNHVYRFLRRQDTMFWEHSEDSGGDCKIRTASIYRNPRSTFRKRLTRELLLASYNHESHVS